jgi:hypothetical protein
MKLLGMADIVDRWVYTKQGVHKLARLESFPRPWATVNLGRTKLWRLEDIESFERANPVVLSEDLKTQKRIGYYLAKFGRDT